MQLLHGSVARQRLNGGLTGWQLQRVTEYIEAGLAGSIRIQELATLAGLSTSQFGRAFRQSTGQSPHRWHLNARIRRAKALMLETDDPLVDIALVVGFADQSHFANTFARLSGGSPGAWRREQRLGQDRALATHDTRSGATAWFPQSSRHRPVGRRGGSEDLAVPSAE